VPPEAGFRLETPISATFNAPVPLNRTQAKPRWKRDLVAPIWHRRLKPRLNPIMALVAFSHGDLPRASLGARLIIACCPRPTCHGTDREIYGPANLGDGFIDGISFDSYGNLCGTMVIADRLIAITPALLQQRCYRLG
jgi:hypothetical protein